MKSGAAIMLALAEYLVNGTKQLESPVLFCFTADEERDGTGAKALAESGLMARIGAMINTTARQQCDRSCYRSA